MGKEELKGGAIRLYMNTKTGSVDVYDGWWYENEKGETVNAVDLDEVVEVYWNEETQQWEEII